MMKTRGWCRFDGVRPGRVDRRPATYSWTRVTSQIGHQQTARQVTDRSCRGNCMTISGFGSNWKHTDSIAMHMPVLEGKVSDTRSTSARRCHWWADKETPGGCGALATNWPGAVSPADSQWVLSPGELQRSSCKLELPAWWLQQRRVQRPRGESLIPAQKRAGAISYSPAKLSNRLESWKQSATAANRPRT